MGEEKTNGGKRFVDVVNQESCRHKEFICGHKETNLLTDLGEIRNWGAFSKENISQHPFSHLFIVLGGFWGDFSVLLVKMEEFHSGLL